MVVEYFSAQLLFPRAAAISGPLKPGITNHPGAAEVGYLSQRPGQDRFVARPVMERTESAPDRMIDKDGARRHDLTHHVEGGADDESRNATTLDDMCDETDGLMAKGSVGDEQGEVNLEFGQFPRHRRRELGLDFLWAAHAAHERQVMG